MMVIESGCPPASVAVFGEGLTSHAINLNVEVTGD